MQSREGKIKMKTNIQVTFNALGGHYLTSADTINADYLCEAITMWAMNTQHIYDAVMNSKRKITSIVFEALIDLTNDHIRGEGYTNYQCANYQLKKWLEEYGNGYDTLTAAVQELAAERE
jgi:hypothetical protein